MEGCIVGYKGLYDFMEDLCLGIVSMEEVEESKKKKNKSRQMNKQFI